MDSTTPACGDRAARCDGEYHQGSLLRDVRVVDEAHTLHLQRALVCDACLDEFAALADPRLPFARAFHSLKRQVCARIVQGNGGRHMIESALTPEEVLGRLGPQMDLLCWSCIDQHF